MKYEFSPSVARVFVSTVKDCRHGRGWAIGTHDHATAQSPMPKALGSIIEPLTLRAAREFARLGMDFDLLALFDEQRHADLETGLERGGLGHAAAGGVAADARLG